MSNYFYGWYYRCQSAEGITAIIPAVHISKNQKTCSIQVISKHGTWNKDFPIHDFRINHEKKCMKIGENTFSEKGIHLDLMDGSTHIKAELRFGAFTRPKKNIMGPFQYVPRMECSHAVYSMQHTVNGKMYINGRKIDFTDGIGYMEGDSGCSFPEKYMWTQSFFSEGSVMLAAAVIPFMGVKFTGTIGIVWWKGKEYRFATYLGANVKKIKNGIKIKQGKYQLRVRRADDPMQFLNAPCNGVMSRKIKESVCCRAQYCLFYDRRVIWELETDCAAFEYEYS